MLFAILNVPYSASIFFVSSGIIMEDKNFFANAHCFILRLKMNPQEDRSYFAPHKKHQFGRQSPYGYLPFLAEP